MRRHGPDGWSRVKFRSPALWRGNLHQGQTLYPGEQARLSMPIRDVGSTGAEYIETHADRPLGAIPNIYLPSAMIHNSFDELWQQYKGIPGPWGMSRAPYAFFNFPGDYRTTGTNPATGDAEMLFEAGRYFDFDTVKTSLARGTLIIAVNTFQHRSKDPSA